MNKKKIGIVAKKLNHSLSPFIHNHWAKNNNNKFIYRKLDQLFLQEMEISFVPEQIYLQEKILLIGLKRKNLKKKL